MASNEGKGRKKFVAARRRNQRPRRARYPFAETARQRRALPKRILGRRPLRSRCLAQPREQTAPRENDKRPREEIAKAAIQGTAGIDVEALGALTAYINLAPGNYTAVVSGAGGSTGVGLAEVDNITGN
ncbi:MAG: hypothetical protein QOG67_1735 [Verrucomicrobiota bacterium]|jgi:hypothetical protein